MKPATAAARDAQSRSAAADLGRLNDLQPPASEPEWEVELVDDPTPATRIGRLTALGQQSRTYGTRTVDVLQPDGQLALQVAVWRSGPQSANVAVLDARGEPSPTGPHRGSRFRWLLSDLTDDEKRSPAQLCQLAGKAASRRKGPHIKGDLHRFIGPMRPEIADDLADTLAAQLAVSVAQAVERRVRERETAVWEHLEAARSELDQVARMMTTSPQSAVHRGRGSVRPVPENHGSLL